MEILLLQYIKLLTALALLLSQQVASVPQKLGHIFGGATTTPTFTIGVSSVQTREVKMIKTFVKDKYVNVFKDGQGNIKEVEITKKEYEALGNKDAVNPTLDGFTWVSSYGGSPVYEVSEPVLNDYEFIQSTTSVKMKLPDKTKIIPIELWNGSIDLLKI